MYVIAEFAEEFLTMWQDRESARTAECDVTTNQIRQWIREERLEFSADSPVQIACEKCGEMIRSGRFCEKCKQQMANGFNEAIRPKRGQQVQKPDTQKGGHDRMRFL